MKNSAPKTLLSILLLLSLLLAPATADDNSLKGPIDFLKQKYEELPENGKFATGAITGFGLSRIALKSAVTVVKFAGAAFVATEAMNAAGVLDDIQMPDAYAEGTENFKRRALLAADGFRCTIREKFNPDKLQGLMKTDRMATMGFCSGAFVGFVV